MADRRRELLRLHEQLKVALIAQMARRRDYPDLEWVDAEREALATAVNRWAGTELMTAADVERVEGPALGHCDYASKLCLYVAELAMSRCGSHDPSSTSR